jgi:hypothetical protein
VCPYSSILAALGKLNVLTLLRLTTVWLFRGSLAFPDIGARLGKLPDSKNSARIKLFGLLLTAVNSPLPMFSVSTTLANTLASLSLSFSSSF